MRRWLPVLTLTAAVGCAAGTPVPETGPVAAAGSEVTAVAGSEITAAASFSAEQAERGRLDFGILCGECHGTSDFRGTNFQYRWRRQTAWDFFRTVTETMPEDAPGSLSDEEYVGVIAYILELNGYSAGEGTLAPTEAALDRLPMDGGTPFDSPDPQTHQPDGSSERSNGD